MSKRQKLQWVMALALKSVLMTSTLFAQEDDKIDQSAYKTNIVVIPRPGALAVGVMLKSKKIDRLSIGPWIEYGSYKDDQLSIDYNSQSLGVLANYNFSKKGAFGSGPTILFIGSIERYAHHSRLGSKMTMFDALAGLYAGYQFSSRRRINGWLGMGYLSIIPFSDNYNLVSNEQTDVVEFFDDQSTARGFPFPGLYLGIAF